ncbi:MAG: MBL fold metallo-hydrolase [Methanoregulaceae archaeon]|jgi:7,8-dihydropterin-6-yl-methyl-4-(beta-D-ribofuranosyl)aminobenzene 5'-phosphate synthase
MELVTLVENNPGHPGLRHQHGLALLIRSGGRQILFDTGQDGTFLENAAMLGIDIRDVGITILSHGHYDHGGGLGAFLAMNTASPVYLRRGADGEFYARDFLRYRYNGLDSSLFSRFPDRFIWVESDQEIAPGIHLLTSFERHYALPAGNRRLLVKRQNRYEKDPFSHELLLVIDEQDGIVVVTGCGHSGILNMLPAAQKRFPDKPLKAVIGGFHLAGNPLSWTGGVSTDGIRAIAGQLRTTGCRNVITGHCTGSRAARILETELGERMVRLSTGFTLEI